MRCDLHVWDDLRTAAVIPLGLAVPVATLANYIVEEIFARWWMPRYRRLRADRGLGAASHPVTEAAV